MKVKKIVLVILVLLLVAEIGFCIRQEQLAGMPEQETKQPETVEEATETENLHSSDAAQEAVPQDEQKTAAEDEQGTVEQTEHAGTNPPATVPQETEIPGTVPAGSSYGTMLPPDEFE